MPVEFTLPLTKLEQAVADARENEKVMLAKVEDAKSILKSAKAAWEEAVGEVFRALDEMIADKRQPSLFDERTTGEREPAPQTMAAETAAEPAAADTSTGQPDFVTVELLAPPTVVNADFPDLDPPAPTAAKHTPAAGPSWRSLVVAEHLDGPGSLFSALDTFGVTTLGGLADALRDGLTFNLPQQQVHDLFEAIEDASQEDERPIRFDRERGVAVTVKEAPQVKERDPGDEWEEILDKRQQQAGDEEREAEAVKVAPVAEPEKPAKKKRGRKPKGEAVAAVGAVPEPVEPAAAVEAEPVEPEPEPVASFDDL